jgi:hypothetical protein
VADVLTDDARELSLLLERLVDEGDGGTPSGAPDIVSGVCRRRLSFPFALCLSALRFCSLEAPQPVVSGEVAGSAMRGAGRVEDGMVTMFWRIRGRCSGGPESR